MIEKFEKMLFEFVQIEMSQDQAHDVNHILRVVKTAKSLCAREDAKLEVVLPAAYLHDCVSVPKNHPDRVKSSQFAADRAVEFLQQIDYPSEYFPAIHHAIHAHSFSAGIEPKSLEAEVVQDADRLDALGAIGVIRCIQVSCSLGVDLYSDIDPFCRYRQPDDRQYTVDHFYTKLFKLKETMRTASARDEAEKRTVFMQEFLDQFAQEV